MCLSKSRSRIRLKVPTGFNKLAFSRRCTSQRIPRSPTTIVVAKVSYIEGVWEANTFTVPWSVREAPSLEGYLGVYLVPIVVPVSVLHKLEDLDFLLQPHNVPIRLLLCLCLISKHLLQLAQEAILLALKDAPHVIELSLDAFGQPVCSFQPL